MLELACKLSQDCPFMFHCENFTCEHDEVWPVSTYTVFIYLFTGISSAFCNVSGNSMGIFKMLILMMLLKYELDEATGLAQAFVVGTALPNFISIIFKKHPNESCSLVNYKLLSIIIPCCLLGSTVGALGQTLIPKIAQISLSVLVFSFFVYSFIQKIRGTCVVQINQGKQTLIQSIEQSMTFQAAIENPQIVKQCAQKLQIIHYEKSMHSPQIALSVGVFLVFQFLSFLVQGKISIYNVQKCSIMYPLGIIFLFGITLGYLYLMKRHMKRVFDAYRRHQIDQEIYLDGTKEFLSVAAGAFAAGLIQGILGMGCGTCIMMVLLSFPIHPSSASATSGYQILFTGSGSLLEYYINGEVQAFESMWMMGVCLTIGGVSTLLLYQLMKRMNQVSVNRLLYCIILALCLMSIALTVPTILGILDKDGWAGMTSITFKC